MHGKRGFSLIEVLVSIALAALVITAVMGGIGVFAKNSAKAIESETLQRLAYEKLQEIIATNDYNTTQGDYSERDIPYSWEASLETTGVEGLERLVVVISYTGSDRDESWTSSTLVYRTEGN